MPSSAHEISLTRAHTHGGGASVRWTPALPAAGATGATGATGRGSVAGRPGSPMPCPLDGSPMGWPAALAAAPVSFAITSVSHTPLPGCCLTLGPGEYAQLNQRVA